MRRTDGRGILHQAQCQAKSGAQRQATRDRFLTGGDHISKASCELWHCEGGQADTNLKTPTRDDCNLKLLVSSHDPIL